MKRQNFFSWYYEQGLHGLLETIKNLIAFFWRFFSVFELTCTLFAPWHRDVNLKTWRGWNPLKSIEILLTNLISRLIGAVVRMVVISLGIIVYLGSIAVGVVLIFLWIALPIFVLLTAVFLFANTQLFLLSFGICVLFCLLVLILYFANTEELLTQSDMGDLVDHPVFERICWRLGIDREEFPIEILENSLILADFLKKLNIDLEEFQEIISYEAACVDRARLQKRFWSRENLAKIRPIGMQWRYGYTVHLDMYSSDLSRADYSEYREDEIIGRENQLDITEMILQRPDQNCVLLVGQSGIGKKTLIHSLAAKIRSRELGGYFANRRILLLDLGRAISDTMNQGGDVENVLRMLFMEASYAGNVILVIEHLEHYLGKESNTFHPDISSVLGEFINIPTLQIIATSTPKEYHTLVEKQEVISKYFQVVEFSEPSKKQTIRILLSKLTDYEKKRIIFSYAALRTIVADAEKYDWEFPMPERAIDLMMEVFTYWSKDQLTQFIMPSTVESYLAIKTGMPQGELNGEERDKLLNLEDILHRSVIGQEEAVGQVAQALRRMRSGIGSTSKPIGSFLFLGPTGVGKTETAKALAKAYFGSEKHMIRLDMSEYQSPSSIDRLIGSAALNQPGQLVMKAKDQPYTLLLLDEIEKAYPTILDLFLQVLDEGYMTDSFGEKINFRNMVIIATSNAGAPLIKKLVGEGGDPEDIKKQIIDNVIEEGVFRVEFLNRFESVVFFRPLNDMELKSVAKLILQKLARRLNKEKNIEISFGDSVVDMIIQKGYDPTFGARSLNRYVDNAVEDLIAKKIISGELQRGEKITIDL